MQVTTENKVVRTMAIVVVGVADCKVSGTRGDSLVTYGLGSCIAVGIYDSGAGVGGLLHFLLPESSADPAKSAAEPATYADSGVALLLDQFRKAGGDARRAKIRLAGGAQMVHAADAFSIGKRNYLAARKVLWKRGLMVESEAVGGTVSRSLSLDLATGQFLLRSEADRGQPAEPPRAVGGGMLIRARQR